ncbi:PLP-dependent aminotransferase family protein [Leucobacter chromiireducens]|uniref:MocR-like pyridoxine biosynthesis transcription factor PdxR n=1 Tax=Leucobacter chromiireducens TaxID=283877 RepID=UPI000F638191|nr:PLP-dependent aminotransferase family protein [Leucobacter chromiireducens]
MDVFPQLSVDRGIPIPLAEQLTSRIREAILAGGIAPGEPLPASRALAGTIGVSRTVVVAAYEQLVGEGFLESRQGASTRVVPELPRWGEPGRHSADPELRAVPAAADPPGAIDLRPGRPFVAATPPRDFVRAMQAAARLPWESDAPDSIGIADLRSALAAHTRRARGIGCTEADVTVTSGTSEALLLLALALRAVHGRAPRIAVEDPGYAEGIRAFARAGAEIVRLPVGADGATARGLRELGAAHALDAVLLTPSHQFPLGGRMPAAERLGILEWARESGALIIEDDYDSEFRHAGALLPALGSLAAGVATITTLNKVLSPSIRCAAIVLAAGDERSRALRAELRAVREDIGPALPLLQQRALAGFLESGGFRRELARTRREYGHRRRLLLDRLTERGIEVGGADGGLHVVLPLGGRDGAAALRALAERGVLADRVGNYRAPGGGTPGGASSDPDDALIVGYGAEPATRLLRGIEIVAAVLTDSPGDGLGVPRAADASAPRRTATRGTHTQ